MEIDAPLDEQMTLQKFIDSHKNNVTKDNQTHTVFLTGFTVPLSISDNETNTFHQLYIDYVSPRKRNDISGVNCISEKVSKLFGFFVDIDFEALWFKEQLNKSDLPTYLNTIQTFLQELIDKVTGTHHDIITTTRLSYKVHLHVPTLVVDKTQAQALIRTLTEHMTMTYPDKVITINKKNTNLWSKVLDTQVYTTGLRLLYSHKGNLTKDNDKVEKLHSDIFPNEPYNHTYMAIDHSIPSLQVIQALSIRRYVTAKKAQFVDESVLAKDPKSRIPKAIKSTGVDDLLIKSLSLSETFDELNDATKPHVLQSNTFSDLNCFINENVMSMTGIDINMEKVESFSNGDFKVTPTLSACPFAKREHKRTAERNNPALWIRVQPHQCQLRCWSAECKGQAIDLGELPDEMQSKLFNLTPEERLVHKCLYVGTHEQITEYIFMKLKDLHAASPAGGRGSSYRWFFYNDKRHRWEENQFVIPAIMNEKGIVQYSLKTAVAKMLATCQDNPKEAEVLQDKWKRLQSMLQNWGFVNASLVPLLALKLHMYHYQIHSKTFVEMLDSNPKLLGFTNGVFDFGNKVFRAGRSSDYISRSTHIAYTPYKELNKTTLDEMVSALRKVYPVDDEFNYMMYEISTCLDGTAIAQRFFILYGYGSNGKSSLDRLINLALGDYAGEADVGLFTKPRPSSSNPTEDVMALRGKRFVVCSEPNSKDSLHLGTIKWLTGGDRITGRGLYEKQQSFYLQCTIFMLCNEIPQIHASQNDNGSWRRLKPRFHRNEFKDGALTEPHHVAADPNINDRMEYWKEAFMSLLIHYNMSPVEYPKPQQFINWETDLRTKCDYYRRFVTEHLCDTSVSEPMFAYQMYDVFKTFIRNNGVSKNVPLDEFIRQMVPIIGEPNVDDSGNKMWNQKLKNATTF